MIVGKVCGLLVVAAATFVVPTVTSAQPSTRPMARGNPVTASANSPNWITVSWQPLRGTFYYQVHRSSEKTFEPSILNQASPPGLQKTIFEDAPVEPSTTYYYAVFSIGPAPDLRLVEIGSATATTRAFDKVMRP